MPTPPVLAHLPRGRRGSHPLQPMFVRSCVLSSLLVTIATTACSRRAADDADTTAAASEVAPASAVGSPPAAGEPAEAPESTAPADASTVPASGPASEIAPTTPPDRAGEMTAAEPVSLVARTPVAVADDTASHDAGTKARSDPDSRGRRAPRVNRPLDFSRLEHGIREKYQLDQLENPAREFEHLQARATAGDAEAEFALGLLLAYGDAEAGDAALAAELFTRAAASGVARAQTELGRLYLGGDGVSADPSRAAQLFAAAWQAGDPEGAFLLATAHRLQLFPGADAAQAAALLGAAAEQGHVAAARSLYGLAKSGDLGVADPRISVWLQAAAETGDMGALLDLADLNLRAQEGEKAFAAFEVAAEAGSAQALWKLMRLSGTSLRDPEVRARLHGMFELHTASPGLSATIAYQSLAFLELFESDRAAATVRAHAYLKEAAARGSYSSKVAAQLLDRGRSLPEVLREVSSLSNEAAYARSQELAREAAPPAPGGDVRPQVRNVVQPKYPVELAADKVSGQAVVRLVVRADGSVTDVRVVSTTHPAFGPAAAAAVQQWTFTPGQSDGRAVNTVMQVPVLFNVSD